MATPVWHEDWCLDTSGRVGDACFYCGATEDPEKIEYVPKSDDVLRLCQAHREIVEAYEVAKAQIALLLERRAHGLDVIEAQGVVTGLDVAVQSLAHGYGIEA